MVWCERAIQRRMSHDNNTRWDNSTQIGGLLVSGLAEQPESHSDRALQPGADLDDLGGRKSTGDAVQQHRTVPPGERGQRSNITGRFLYYVTGSGSGDENEDGGSLVKHVRLVE